MTPLEKLGKKLAEKKQDIIRGYRCKCGKFIVYLLTNRGSASSEPEYLKCNELQTTVYDQAGRTHVGYKLHKCKTNDIRSISPIGPTG